LKSRNYRKNEEIGREFLLISADFKGFFIHIRANLLNPRSSASYFLFFKQLLRIFLFSVFHFPLFVKNSASVCVNLWLILSFASFSFAQKVAVLTPEKKSQSQTFAEKLEVSLSKKFKILDDSLSDAAYRARNYEKPFNLSLDEAKDIGAAVGCDYFLLLRAETLPRYSFENKEFYESYAAIFAVSSRTGRLVFWRLVNGESKAAKDSESKLLDSVNALSNEIFDKLKIVAREELNEKSAAKLEDLPAENSPEAKNFRPPLPYRRIRPEYTRFANLYSVEATVDALIEIDENGRILKTEIARWAGFGLDESVVQTVNKMQWRAATRDGKTLPLRVLLRYNFKKIENDK